MAAQLPERVSAALHGVLARLADGTLDIALTELVGLDAAPAAQQELAAGAGSGKRVVRVQ
jgi:NADPH-dependent curcumin reductase CurA